MKILHTADWHLKDSEIEEAERCLNHLVREAGKENVDLVIVAGDAFNSQDVKLDSKAAKLAARIFSELADIAPVVVVLGTPSHDGRAPEILRFVKGDYPTHVADTPFQVLVGTKSGLALATLFPAPTKQYFETTSDVKGSDSEIAQAMGALFAGFGVEAARTPEGTPHILVGHWNTTGSLISETQTLTGVDIEISPDMMDLARPDLVCLGHIHLHQRIKDRIFYSGSLFPQTWGERGQHGFYIHTLEGKSLVEFRFIPSPHRIRERLQFDLTANGEFSFQDHLEPVKPEASEVRIDITCWQDEASLIDVAAITEYVAAGNDGVTVDVRIARIPRENVRADKVLKAETLRDKLIAAAALRDETVPESILHKADLLDTVSGEQVVAMTAGGIKS